VNRYARVLRRKHVDAIVVLAHSGATPHDGDPADASGEILDEAAQMTRDVDVIIAGHSHALVNTQVPRRGAHGGMLVVESRCYGFAYDRVLLTIDRAAGRVVRTQGEVVPVLRDEVGEDRRVKAVVDTYKRRLQSIAGTVVAEAERPLIENGDGNRELLSVAAQGQRRLAHANLAIADRQSLRDGLAPGKVTYADAFGVQAYDHDVWRLRIGGRRLLRVLRRVDRDGQLMVAGDESAVRPDRRYTVALSALLLDAPELRGLRAVRSRARVGTETEAFAGELARRGKIG
jgi:5'-nucleotidase